MSASIVIPAFNAEATLAPAIRSALAQDYTPVDVIVVDDGSTDGTAAVATSFAPVRYLRQENRGPESRQHVGE